MKHNVMKRNEITMSIVVNKYQQSKKRGFCVNLNTVIFTVCVFFCGKLRLAIINNFKILILPI